jgi:anaerobic selenocysteine-containing dehydrogenase
MDVEVRDGKIFSVSGGKDNPVTNGFLCPRGMGDLKRVYSSSRVLYPRIRDGPKPGSEFKRVSWEEALKRATSKLGEVLKEYGHERVLLLDSSGNTGLITSQFGTRLWSAIEATHTDHSICSRSGHEALKLHYGLSYGVSPENLPSKRIIIFWGFNAKVSSAHQWALAMRAREKGAFIVVIDPRRSESAEAADLWLSPRPGTDVALAYGVARHIIEAGHADMDFIATWTAGFEAYREETQRWTPRRVESITGVSRENVDFLADLLIERRPSAVMMGIGFQKSSQGAEAIRAVSLLPSLIGEHRGFYYTNSRGRFIDSEYLSGINKSGGKWRTVSEVSVGKLLRTGEFNYVYVLGMNPTVTLPDLTSVREGFSRDDVYVVVHDTHMMETCDYADLVLPAATFFEKEDVVISDCHPYTRLSKNCIEPLGESRSEAWVMREMAKLLGRSEPPLYEDPIEAVKKAFEYALEDGTTFDLIRGTNLKIRERSCNEYQTPSGKIEFYSSIEKEGITPLPRQLPVETEGKFLVLLNSALPQWTHSQFRDVYGEIPRFVWMNVEDAARLGIENGDIIVLQNNQGEINVKASVGDKVKPGVLWSPRPMIDGSGGMQNALVSSVSQSLGGGPLYNSIRVRILKKG